jgi:hypothetical protein
VNTRSEIGIFHLLNLGFGGVAQLVRAAES